MKITKHFLREVFDETVSEFNQKIFKIDNDVELAFIDKEKYMEDAKVDPLHQLQISLGIYKDFDKEFPNFMVVYLKDKNPMMKLFGLPYKVSVCYEKAKDILKPYPKEAVKSYLKRMFVHELCHIVENDLKNVKPDLWDRCVRQSGDNEKMAHELFVEFIADMMTNKKSYQKIYDSVWQVVNNRMKKLEREKVKI